MPDEKTVGPTSPSGLRYKITIKMMMMMTMRNKKFPCTSDRTGKNIPVQKLDLRCKHTEKTVGNILMLARIWKIPIFKAFIHCR
jgi:hypothetical protein